MTPISSTRFTIILTLFFTFVMNLKIVLVYFNVHQIKSIHDILQMVCFFLFLSFLIFSILNTFNFKFIQKPAYTLFFLVSAPALYFSLSFNTLYDRSMIRNLLETDVNEAMDLMNPTFIMTTLVIGLVPVLLLWKIPVRYQTNWKTIPKTLIVSFISFLLAIASTFPYYSNISSFVSNNSDQLAYSLLPYAPIDSFYQNVKAEFKEKNIKKELLDASAKIGEKHKILGDKPLVVVVLIGETARAKSFQLKNIQGAESIEHLTDRNNLIYFTDFWSCGTNTAASLPCMFSTYPKKSYKRDFKRRYENVAELIKRVGYDVTWIENNSGCKGLCNQFEKLRINESNSPTFKRDTGFYDEALVDNLAARIRSKSTDQVIFLHTMGSHGPAYYKRVPDDLKFIQPACESDDFSNCTDEEITNAYNNSVLYTKHVIGRGIDELEKISEEYNTLLIYLSDHGESTGGNGYYLHGLPYFMAPDVQKHIPALIWMSDTFITSHKIDFDCMLDKKDEPFSHDYFSHTLINILDIETIVYNKDLNLLDQCEK